MPLWLIILLIILLIIIIYFLFNSFTAARYTGPSWGISNVTLTIAPTSVTCGTGVKFACTVNAFGWADNATPRNYKVELYDDEINDDLLATFTSVSGTTPGISPTAITGSVLFNWSKTHSFNLFCNSSCNVEGPDGSSGESDPDVYAVFTVMHGTPYPSMESTRVKIKCVKA